MIYKHLWDGLDELEGLKIGESYKNLQKEKLFRINQKGGENERT